MTDSEDEISNRVTETVKRFMDLHYSKEASITTALIEEIAALQDKIYGLQNKVHRLEKRIHLL